MDIFNNREIASFIWLGILIFWLSFKKEIRAPFLSALNCFWKLKIILPIIAMMAYVSGIIYSLHLIGYWNIGMLKDSVVWFFISALVTASQAVTSLEKNTFFFREIVLNSIKLIIVFEFIVNFYTFPLWGELLFLPIVTMIACIDAYLKYKKEYNQLKNVIVSILSIIGLLMLAYAIFNIINDYRILCSYKTLKNFLLAPILTLLSYPFIYLLALFAAYESLFLRLKIGNKKNKKVKQYAKFRLICFCKLNLKKVKQVQNMGIYNIMGIDSKLEVDEMIKTHKNLYSPH